MRELIKKLQNKPEHIRKQILYLSTAALSLLVIVFWVITLEYRFSTMQASSIKEDLKPLGLIKDNLVDTYGQMAGQIKNIKSKE